jgi:hypothetical protein
MRSSSVWRVLPVLLAVLALFAGACNRGNDLENIRRQLQNDDEGESGGAENIKPPPKADPTLTGRVGLVIATNSPSFGKLTTSADEPGVVVLFVQPGGPADGVGIQTGDVITAVDGEPSRNAELAVVQLRAKPGTARRLTVAKAGGAGTAEIRVSAERPPPDVNLRQYYDPAIAANEQDPIPRFLRAQTAPPFNEALEDVERAVEIAPGFVEAISLRAELLWNQSRQQGLESQLAQEFADRAMNDWGLALELDPSNTRTMVSRAQALSQGGSRQGKEEADKAIALDDTFPGAYYAQGLAEILRSRYAQAAEPLRKAIELNPYDVRYYELLAHTFVNLNRRDDARETVNAIIDLVDDAATRQNLEQVPDARTSRNPAPRQGEDD